MTYLLLFYEFFKTGLFAVGGGLATLPFLMELAEKYPWFTKGQLADMIAVSEATPGPIGVNMATYAGFSAGGAAGSAVATIALILPAFLIMLFLSKLLMRYRKKPLVDTVFSVLRPAVMGLVAAAGYRVLEISVLTLDVFRSTGLIYNLVNLPSLIMLVVFTFLVYKVKLHPIIYIAAAAGLGIVFKM